MPLRPTCLLTRPRAASEALARDVAPLVCHISPVLRIVAIPHDSARAQAAVTVVLTSAQAVPFAGDGAGRRAICVGPQTARAALARGFDVIEGPGDAAGMLDMLGRWPDALHLHGRHRVRDLGIAAMAVYDQLAQPLDAQSIALSRGDAPLLVPVFSPRSARLVAEGLRGACAPIHLISISAAAEAAFVEGFGGPLAARYVAAHPSRGAMLAMIRLSAQHGPNGA